MFGDYCLSIVFISVLAYSPCCKLSKKYFPFLQQQTVRNDKTKMMVYCFTLLLLRVTRFFVWHSKG